MRWTAILALIYGATLGVSAAANEANKLEYLVREGSIEHLAAYLSAPGADINARPDVDKALLDYAAEQNEVVVATWLLDHGAMVDPEEERGFRKVTPLDRAASFNALEVAQLLIARGANVNANRAHGTTPLLFAAAAGHTSIVELLLRNGADTEVSTAAGQTPLSEAARKGYLDIVKLLGAHGASLDDDRALSDAAFKQQIGVVRYLLNHDQSQNSKDSALRFAVLAANSSSDTASLDIVSTLIAANADVNNTIHGASNTPLMLAKRAELRELLVTHGALDLDAVMAARANQDELRDILMTLGRARVLGPTMDIAAIRIMRKSLSADGPLDETSAAWRHLKDTIAQDLRYDVGTALLVRADEIASRWREALESDLSANQGVALIGFFKSELGQHYLAFQSRLGSIQEDGIVAIATRNTGAKGRRPAPTRGELLDQRRRLLGLGWNASTNRCCDDAFQWMATQGKGSVPPDEIAEVMGLQLDALRTDYLSELDAFATFQQSPASISAATVNRKILEQTAAGTEGSMQAVATTLQRSEQAHQPKWHQIYRTLSTKAGPESGTTVTASARPAAVELPSCVESPLRRDIASLVTGLPGERLYVSPKHPRECSETGINACPDTAYLMVGDEVQAQSTCDEWTRVSYKGTRGTIVGWVISRRLGTPDNLPLPHFDLGPPEPERASKVVEPEVCQAAGKGTVEDAGLRDVTRYSFAAEFLRVDSKDYLPGSPEVIAEGSVDLLNEGQPQRVVLMSVSYSDFHTEWPLVLNADGLPDRTIAIYHKLFQSAGDADHTRLFRFHGVTYMEHVPIGGSEESRHEVWRFSRSEAVKICDVD